MIIKHHACVSNINPVVSKQSNLGTGIYISQVKGWNRVIFVILTELFSISNISVIL